MPPPFLIFYILSCFSLSYLRNNISLCIISCLVYILSYLVVGETLKKSSLVRKCRILFNRPAMRQKVFITGASGCIGHYILDRFISNQYYEPHLLVRDPGKLRFNYEKYPHVHIHTGDMKEIEHHRAIIREMDYVIHVATDWSDSDYAEMINVEKTLTLFSYANEGKCRRIVYFSTASILGPGNKPTEAAGKYGTGYIRSKYKAYQAVSQLPYRDKIITLFPTLVFGGDDKHPYSHISSGIVPNLHYMKLIRFFYFDGAFHFLHSKDIAAVTEFVMAREVKERDFVLGNSMITARQAIRDICTVFGIPIYFQVKIQKWFVFFMAKLFNIQIGPWDKHCIENPYMTYKTVNPKSFGLTSAYPSLKDVLTEVKRLRGR